ncbi:hypothetical protein Tco_0794875 [Tanacetum coccineum]
MYRTYESDDEQSHGSQVKKNVMMNLWSEDDDDDGNNDDDDDDDADNQDAENQDDDDDDDEQTDLDNDGDDFVHPKFSTHDEEDKEEDSFDPRVQTPSHVESTDYEDSDEEIQDANVKGDKMNEEETNEEAEVDELYSDVNVNLEGRDTEMTDASLPNVQGTQVTEDTHLKGQQQSSCVSSGFVSNMLNPSPDTGIDIIFTLNTEATSLVDVSVTNTAEPPLLSAITLPPTPLITHLQQTPVPAPTTVPCSSLQDLPNFGSLFGIVDAYLAIKMHEAIKTVVQLQCERLRDESQAKNADFLNKLDDNIKKIIKDQVNELVKAQVSKILPKIEKTVNEQLEAEVMTCSSTESKTFLAIAANLSKLELKKILIDKMESNKSIHRSDEQKNLYKALVDAYESDKLILDTYGDTVSFKRCRDDEDKDEEPTTGSNWGSKRKRARKEPESTSAPKEKTSKTSGKTHEGSKSQHKTAGKSAQTEKPMHTTKDMEEPAHQEFETGVTKDQHNEETPRFPDCSLAQKEDPRESFNEMMDTPLDFSAFVMNRIKVDTLTPELLAGPTFELMKGTCKSLVELEYFFEEVYKATTDQLDWNNPKEALSSQRRVEDLYLWSSKSYQKKLNLTKPDTYRSDLKRREAYTTYSNLRGFIYQNKDKKNRLMRIDELHKFSDGTLNDVRTALNDRLKGIRMEYLPQTIWRQSDKDKAGAMIQAIDKQLKTRRIMRSLEKFVGGRPYEDKMDSMHSTLSMYYDYGAHVKGELLVVRHRYSNPMIQPELEGSTQGYPLDSVEVLRVLRIILVILPEHQSDTQVITMKMEILPESTSNKLMVGDLCNSIRIKLVTTGKKRWCDSIRIKLVPEHAEFDESNTNVLERFYTSAGNPVKEILLKLNLPDQGLLKDGGEVKEFQRSFSHSDTERLSRSDEVLKLKNFKKDAALKLFKSTNQERYEHVGPEVTSSQDDIVYKKAKRDYAWLMVSRCSRSYIHLQIKQKEQAQA